MGKTMFAEAIYSADYSATDLAGLLMYVAVILVILLAAWEAWAWLKEPPPPDNGPWW